MTDPRQTIATAPMSKFQIVAVAVCVIATALDGFDVLSISFASPGIAEEWKIDRAALGVVLSMELVGMAIGSIAIAARAHADDDVAIARQRGQRGRDQYVGCSRGHGPFLRVHSLVCVLPLRLQELDALVERLEFRHELVPVRGLGVVTPVRRRELLDPQLRLQQIIMLAARDHSHSAPGIVALDVVAVLGREAERRTVRQVGDGDPGGLAGDRAGRHAAAGV